MLSHYLPKSLSLIVFVVSANAAAAPQDSVRHHDDATAHHSFTDAQK